MGNSKPLIFVFGDGPQVHTGFGCVHRNIFRRLKDKYNLVFLAINYNGDPLPENREFPNCYPCIRDPYGRDRFGSLLHAYKPDLLFTTNDFDALMWVPQQLIDVRNKTQKDISWLFYFPVDCGPVYKKYTDFLRTYVDIPVTVTEFGQKEILKTDPDFNVPYIYHGVDSGLFRPIDSDQPIGTNNVTVNQEKERLGIKDTFNIMMVGVNQIRKQYNIAVEAFAEFAKDKKDVRLILHCAKNTSCGWDLEALIDYYSDKNEDKGNLPINKRVLFTGGIVGPLGIDERGLALLYNFADVFMNTSCGEGYALPVAEAMSSGLPVIIHNATAPPEIVGDAGLLVDTEYEYIFPFQDRTLVRPIPDKDQIVEHLNELYENKNLRKQLGTKARERIISDSRFNWDYVAHEMDKKIQEGLNSKRSLDLSAQEIL